MRRSRWLVPGFVLLVLLGGTIGVVVGSMHAVPVRVLTDYPVKVLAEEAATMSACAECHDTAEFHRCTTCHDEHGALELSDVPFYAVVAFEGDVPEPGYVLVDDVLPYRDQPNTHVALTAFLSAQGVADFDSVTLASDDGGFVTIERQNLTDAALLLPYEDGIRFASPDLHVSAWLKGIRRVVVVGQETPLEVDGRATSMGRLLLGPVQSVTVEQADVMFKSEDDGQVRTAQAGSRINGILVSAILADPSFTTLTVRSADGTAQTVTVDEARGALLAQVRGQATLVFPDRGRGQWVADVVALESQ